MGYKGFFILMIAIMVSLYYAADGLGFDVSSVGGLLMCYFVALGLSFIVYLYSSL